MADKPEQRQWVLPPTVEKTPRQPERQQSLLPLTESAEAERIARVRGALAQFGLQARVADDLEKLILYLDRYGSEGAGCRARIKTLSEHLRRPARSIQRRLAELREWGIVETFTRDWLPINRVNWDRLKELACAARAQVSTAQKSGATPRHRGADPCQSGATPRHGGAPISNLFNSYYPPPTPSAPQGTGWGEAVFSLEAAGMAKAGEAAAIAQVRGLSPQDVHSLIAHWNAHRPAWQVGAIFHVLRLAQPGRPASEAPWPPKSDAWERSQRRAAADRRQQDQAAADAEQRAQREAESQRLEQLETRYGGDLDRLSDPEWRELLTEVAPPLLEIYRVHGRDSPLIRETLLDHFAHKSHVFTNDEQH